ncbi:MAG: DUF349 domain-containing protein [Bacteroidota bacterium]
MLTENEISELEESTTLDESTLTDLTEGKDSTDKDPSSEEAANTANSLEEQAPDTPLVPPPSTETGTTSSPSEDTSKEQVDSSPAIPEPLPVSDERDSKTENTETEVTDPTPSIDATGSAEQQISTPPAPPTVEAPSAEEAGDPLSPTPTEESAPESPVEADQSSEPAEPLQITEEAISLTPAQEEILQKIEEILESEEESSKLPDANPTDLIGLIAFFAKGPIRENIPKVGLVKKSFDAIRATGDVSEEDTEIFREALAGFNKVRAENKKQVENEKLSNAQKKRNLLVQLKEIIDSDDVYRIGEVREIQDKWKQIGHVPKKDLDEMYKEYRSLLDNFYQKREMHFELLEYDRKINLQEKEKLIEEAKKLIPEDDQREEVEVWKQKMDMFHELQQQWRSIGHVPREDMERVRDEFRSIVDQFFEARQEYVDIIDKHREENAQKKEELLGQMQEFTTFKAAKPREWNTATQSFRALQEEWKALGPAPKAVNNELWQKYRKVADEFFTAKSNFFKELDNTRAENLAKKISLCEQVEALKGDSNWEKTARLLKKLQQDWKAIGPVPERHSNKVWNRFKSACDAFFEERRKHYQVIHKDENENLEKKRVLIEEVKILVENQEVDVDVAIERVKEIQREWKKIGKVPYKEKDKIWEEFRGEVDIFFNGLSEKRENRRNVRFKSTLNEIKDDDKRVKHIRAKISGIRKRVQRAQEKVDQYSNNMLFIAKGKSGDKLRKQIQDELDKEIAQIDSWKKQMRELDHLMRNPPEETQEEEKPVAAEVPEEKPKEEDIPAVKGEAQTSEQTPSTEDSPVEIEPETPKVEEETPETANSPQVQEAKPASEETTTPEAPTDSSDSEEEGEDTTPETPEETKE